MKRVEARLLTLIAAEVNQIAVCLEGIMMALEIIASEDEEEDKDYTDLRDGRTAEW